MNARHRLLSTIAILVVLLALVCPVAMADEKTSTGQFTAANSAPVVNSVTLNVGGDGPTSSMTPQATGGYDIVVSVTDVNTLNDLTEVEVTLFYDADADNDAGDVPTSGNAQSAAILTWTKSTGLFTADFGSSTTWSLDNVNCVAPTLTGSTDSWTFRFVPGTVAQEHATEWDIYATATDASTSDDLYDGAAYAMEWWGQLTVGSATLDFGSVSPGEVNNDSDNFTLTSISNGTYNLALKSAAAWVGGSTSTNLALNGGGSPGNAELALKADDDATVADAQQITGTYAMYTGHGTDTGPTVEAGANLGTNTMWLSLGSTGIVNDTYTGLLYFQITNG